MSVQSPSLWTFEALVAAAAGQADGTASAAIRGFSIDTRSLAPGDLFVALKDQRDGHDFVSDAFRAGAAAALVSRGYERRGGDGSLIRVDDTLAALERIAIAARARLVADARVIAVTGSAGKTGTKEMLREVLTRVAPDRVHASDKSFNNHWGVPLTLARMPADTRYAVLEIGMNHAGEITPLSRLARPHVAIITTVEAVHLAAFSSVEEIADAKAEIFAGLEPGGAAILNADNPHFDRLAGAARGAGARIISFGKAAGATIRLDALESGFQTTRVAAMIAGAEPFAFSLAIPGEHIAMNALAVAGALWATGDFSKASGIARALAPLATIEPPPGRGRRFTLDRPEGTVFIIDESYNANPASMRAALSVLAMCPRDARHRRRVAVLGDMLELGPEAPALHAGLAPAVTGADVDLVFASGPNMAALFACLPERVRGGWAASSAALEPLLLDRVAAGDVIMVKGSNGSRMAPLVAALRAKFGAGGD